MDRRNFLRMGSLAVLGSLAAPSLALPDTVRGIKIYEAASCENKL